ncbi:hypothetical protein OUZ56_007069 [Daphnia magna]|uniref:Uncharacterized protein n=1 Tax=Daphnia magna TaxID=35525 RepID=A0ABQ9YXH6_9CRUS|nr:hypothetical protein OUZ56_007069 [Daphnia magna]
MIEIRYEFLLQSFHLVIFYIQRINKEKLPFIKKFDWIKFDNRAVKHPALRVLHKCAKSHLCPSWYAAAAASYGETNFFIGSSLLAEEFRLLPEIRLLQGDEQQTIHKQ